MILKGKANPVKKHSGKSKRAKKSANKMEEKIGKDNSQKDCQDPVCPLCMDHLDYDDINFYPCQCGYQICRFCWHRIRTEENSLCPNCRRLYSEDPATFKSVSLETMQKLRNERKQKEIQKKKEQAESRKQLANIRVVQKNLVFVHGLPQGIDHSEKYKKLQQIFKDFGPVVKCVVNNKTSYVGSQIPRASVYVTYQRIEDALRAYKSLPSKIEEFDVKTSLGTTKYCSNFLKNAHCPKQDCMYLHEQADEELCFTKDQIHNGDHLDFGDQLYEKMVNHSSSKSPQTSQQKDSGPLLIEQQEEALSKLSSLQIQEPLPTPTSSPRPTYSNEPSTQSKLQHLFSSSRDHPSEQVNGSDGSCSSDAPRNYEEYRNKFMSQCMDSSANGDSSSIQKSLLEDNFVNTPLRTIESLHMPDKEIWPEHRNLLHIQTNNSQFHQNTGNVPEYLLNHVNSTSQALQGLQFRKDDGPFHPQRESPELEAPDDDLGFDPIGLAMSGLANILKNSQPPQTIKHDSLWNSHTSQRIIDPSEQQQALQYKLQMQRLKNPPPGFPVNHVQQNQSLPSPVYNPADTSSNVLINRMSPPPPIHQFRNSVRAGRYHQSRVVLNGNSLINRMPTINASSYLRPNFQTQRYQPSNVAMNGMAAMNGYSSQSLRNIAPQSIPLQTPSMQEMLARSVANTQHIQSQSQNISQMPFGHIDQNLSPSLWNVNQSPVNQTQWMHPENSFPGQSMQDFRPASPSLSLSRRVHPQLRPEFTRQFPQPLARFTNPPTFTDNPQFMYPSAQHNQLTKGVHTFP